MNIVISLALWSLLAAGTWIGFVEGVRGAAFAVSFVVLVVLLPLALTCLSVAVFDTPTCPLPPPSAWRWVYRSIAAGILVVLVWNGAPITAGVFAFSLACIHCALHIASCSKT